MGNIPSWWIDHVYHTGQTAPLPDYTSTATAKVIDGQMYHINTSFTPSGDKITWINRPERLTKMLAEQRKIGAREQAWTDDHLDRLEARDHFARCMWSAVGWTILAAGWAYFWFEFARNV